ncbi:MAG: metallophosphoesterase, partial [Lachnospiraceae bacterium]|nr:metallophosphoesterase [Lachnospiraceae bacterium]
MLFTILLLALTLFTGCGTYSSSAESLSEIEVNQKEEIAIRNDPIWSDEENLRAMIISDLHYTENKDVNPAIVPGIALAEEITDVIAAQVIDMHPDVLIMTGDNTDTGRAEDASGLVQRLQKIRDNGIPIILTTGNHDFNHMTADEFENAYFGLLNPVDRDPDSLSYTAIVKDVVFLAMDDNYLYSGAHGEFSGKTLQWLSEML